MVWGPDMSSLGAGYVWPGGQTSPARVSGIWLGGHTSSLIGPTGVTDFCSLGIWFPYITHGNHLGFEHFSFVKNTMLHPSL
jgi:hypothetical protein